MPTETCGDHTRWVDDGGGLSRRGLGYLLGGGISLAWLATFLVSFLMSLNDPYLDEPSDREILWSFVWLAIPLAGYLAATLVTVLRSTRRVGQGMLIGLTVTLPFAIAIVFGISVSNSP
jgi:ABC-type Mn2+/Zn2+ transport system permease subunit